MRNPLFFVFLGIFFFACDNPSDLDEVEVQDDAGNVIERFSVKKDSYAKEGLYQAFFPTGELLEESNYTDNTLNGVRKVYYLDGTLQIEEHHEMGQFVGSFKAYHPNSELELAGEYINNAMEGEWKAFYDNGQLREVVQFSENQENGPFIEYHSNGNLKTEGTYLDGDTEHGPLKEYNEEGVLVRKADCDMGICRTTWRLESEEDLSN